MVFEWREDITRFGVLAEMPMTARRRAIPPLIPFDHHHPLKQRALRVNASETSLNAWLEGLSAFRKARRHTASEFDTLFFIYTVYQPGLNMRRSDRTSKVFGMDHSGRPSSLQSTKSTFPGPDAY